MIELIINHTAQAAGRNQERYRTGIEHQRFHTLTDAKAYLKERYGSCKRRRMYIDRTGKGTVHIGWVYGFTETAYDTGRPRTYYIEDWVEVWETTRIHLPLNKKG